MDNRRWRGGRERHVYPRPFLHIVTFPFPFLTMCRVILHKITIKPCFWCREELQIFFWWSWTFDSFLLPIHHICTCNIRFVLLIFGLDCPFYLAAAAQLGSVASTRSQAPNTYLVSGLGLRIRIYQMQPALRTLQKGLTDRIHYSCRAIKSVVWFLFLAITIVTQAIHNAIAAVIIIPGRWLQHRCFEIIHIHIDPYITNWWESFPLYIGIWRAVVSRSTRQPSLVIILHGLNELFESIYTLFYVFDNCFDLYPSKTCLHLRIK